MLLLLLSGSVLSEFLLMPFYQASFSAIFYLFKQSKWIRKKYYTSLHIYITHLLHYQTITFIYGLTEANCLYMTDENEENSTGELVIFNCVPAL